MTPTYSYLVITGWHGATATQVVTVGQTKNCYRIRAITRTKLAGRGRWLEPGKTALVPKTAVRHGEWSNLHDRGDAALELAASLTAERDALRQQLEAMTRERDEARAAWDSGVAELTKASYAQVALVTNRLHAYERVADAARDLRYHECIIDDANCAAGDHDDCGLREKRALLDASVDALDAEDGQ